MEISYLSAMAVFDRQTAEKIRKLKATMCENTDSCDILPPHMTLGMYTGVSQKELLQWGQEFCSKHRPVPVLFNHIGFLGDRVCFLGPCTNQPLLALHQAFHAKYDTLHGEVGYNYAYYPGCWTPHSTLLMGDKQQLERAMLAAIGSFSPFEGVIEGIAIGQFSPIRQLGFYTLAG